MRIVAIDASPARGVIGRSIEAAARAAEATGASVERFRLARLTVRSCTGCGMCRYTGSCKIEDDLPAIAGSIAEADGVIFGMPGFIGRPDAETRSVLSRLSSFFRSDGQLPLPGFGMRDVPPCPTVMAQKRAVIITATAAPEPIATFFGYTNGPVRELRRALGTSGIRTIGSLSLTGSWKRESFDEWEEHKASSLGRVLAGRI